MVARPSLASLSIVLALALDSAGLGAQSDGGWVRKRLHSGGIERSYLVRPPAGGRTVRALVIMLHGHGGSAAGLVGRDPERAAPYREWIPIADREGLILAAPDGVISPDQQTGWNDCRADSPVLPAADDVAFLDGLIAAVGRDYGTERWPVFVVGTSNGGFMATRMAMERPERVAAAASIAAPMPAEMRCTPTKGVPVLFMIGTADPILPFRGGAVTLRGTKRGTILSAEEAVGYWRKLDRTADGPIVDTLPDLDPADGSRVTRETYTAAGRPTVVFYRIEGGGHTEPSRVDRYVGRLSTVLGPQNGDVEMAEEVWRFFSAQLRDRPRGSARGVSPNLRRPPGASPR